VTDALWQQLTWDVARIGGFVAYALVLGSVVLGLVLANGWRSVRYPRFVTTELHRFITLLAIVFTAVHGLAVAVDPFARFAPAEILVPFLSHYRPAWMALGIIGAYLLVALHLSERLRSRIGYAAWRRLHALTFAVYVLVTLHGLATGSDTRAPWAIALYVGGAVAVGSLLVVRLLPLHPDGRRHPWAAAGVTLGAMAAIVWATIGPLAPGWSAAAGGTLTAAIQRSARATPTAPPVEPIALPFQATIRGTARQTTTAGGIVVIDATLAGTVRGTVHAEIPLSGSGVAPLTVSVEPTGATCTGELTFARENVIGGSCSLADGRVLQIAMRVGLDEAGALTGILQASTVRAPGSATN